jgi:hypothetical protein
MKNKKNIKIKKIILPDVRICMNCRWIFRYSVNGFKCPKCNSMDSRGGRKFVGNKIYRFFKTQELWFFKKNIELTGDNK